MDKLVYLCTGCSKLKNVDEGLLPANERYLSPRIKAVEMRSHKENLNYLILSGKFGLISPNKKIAYYDKLLKIDDLAEMLKTVIKQLEVLNPKEIIYVHYDSTGRYDLLTYETLIAGACFSLNVKFSRQLLDGIEPSQDDS